VSDCGVCIYSDCDEYGYSDFCYVDVRKARKPHRCCECGKQIEAGEKYEHSRSKFDGDFSSCDTCLICVEIGEAFYCDGRMIGGGLWDNMDYVMDRLTTSCFDKLKTPEAKAELRRRWIEWKGLHA
jgi:hypothetical protein